MLTEIQLYVFAFGFLCGVAAASLLLLGGVGRVVVLLSAIAIAIALIVAHYLGINLAVNISSTAHQEPLDLNLFLCGCGGGKGMIGLLFPRRVS